MACLLLRCKLLFVLLVSFHSGAGQTAFSAASSVAPNPQHLHGCLQWDDNHHTYNFDMRKGRIECNWFKGGKTNITYNCLDRWVASGHGNQLCFIWEGNDLGHERVMTYQQVLNDVCRVVSDCIGGVKHGGMMSRCSVDWAWQKLLLQLMTSLVLVAFLGQPADATVLG